MENLVRAFVDERVWAVVGVSTNPAKYGNKIFRDLREAGYTVYGVNIRGGQVDGQQLYRSLAKLPVKPSIVDIVLPPEQTAQIVQECVQLGLTRVWMQPGAESEEAVQLCRQHGIDVVFGTCAMIRKRVW